MFLRSAKAGRGIAGNFRPPDGPEKEFEIDSRHVVKMAELFY